MTYKIVDTRMVDSNGKYKLHSEDSTLELACIKYLWLCRHFDYYEIQDSNGLFVSSILLNNTINALMVKLQVEYNKLND